MRPWERDTTRLERLVRFRGKRGRDTSIAYAARTLCLTTRRVHALASESEVISVAVAVGIAGAGWSRFRLVGDYVLEYVGG